MINKPHMVPEWDEVQARLCEMFQTREWDALVVQERTRRLGVEKYVGLTQDYRDRVNHLLDVITHPGEGVWESSTNKTTCERTGGWWVVTFYCEEHIVGMDVAMRNQMEASSYIKYEPNQLHFKLLKQPQHITRMVAPKQWEEELQEFISFYQRPYWESLTTWYQQTLTRDANVLESLKDIAQFNNDAQHQLYARTAKTAQNIENLAYTINNILWV